MARAAAFGSKVITLHEPPAALGVKESRKVLELNQDLRSRGIPILLISRNLPHMFEIVDRIHVLRLGRRLCVNNPRDCAMSDAVAFMTGAKDAPKKTDSATSGVGDSLGGGPKGDPYRSSSLGNVRISGIFLRKIFYF